jgi:hypothetical protein
VKSAFRQELLAVAPRIVGDEPADMAQEVADTDARGIAGWIAPGAHLRHVVFCQRVERQSSLVAQLQYGERRECFRHRGDSEQSVGLDGLACFQILYTHRPDMNQPSLADDAVD